MSFKDLTEQREVAERLQRSLRNGRLAHAYLLIGPRGSGKEEVARTLAQALNCEQQDHDACGKCYSCRLIQEGEHPDVRWVKPVMKSRVISVDQIRELESVLALKPAMGRMKVAVIEEADRMNPSSSNAFLKTLEEPPARTIILLLTSDPQQLLPTILSRCLRLTLGPTVATESVYRKRVLPLLVEFAGDPKPGVAAIYRFHAALTKLLEQIKVEVEKNLEKEEGELDTDNLEPEALVKLEEEFEARVKGELIAVREQVLQELYTWFSDVLLCVENAPAELLEHPDQLPVLQQAAAGLNHVQAERQVEAIVQIRDALSRNIVEAFALEVGLLKLVAK